MLHKLKLQLIPFTKIKKGIKTIESRLYDKKRQLINIGDTLEFSLVDSEETCFCEVIALLRYPTFSELMQDFTPEYFGWDSIESALSEINQFYTKEAQLENGVIGIKIKLL